MRILISIHVVAAGLALLAPGFVSAQSITDNDPIGDVAIDMKIAANQLAKRTTDKPTQKPQTDAIEKLDKLIAELEKERDSMNGTTSNPNPSDPAKSSTVRGGPGGQGDMKGPKEQGDRWAQLPPHERDRILQSMTEGFPAHYQNILEAYYKRLATEKPADTSAPTKPAPKANKK
jgi:hypothetical protein